MWMLALAALFFAVSVPLALGKVPPNRLYGFRTPRTLADDRVWYPVNRVAGRRGMGFSIVFAGLSVLAMIGMLATSTVLLAIGGLGLATLVSMFVSAARITAQVDAGGPRIDYSSTFERNRKRDAARDRSKLFDKLS